MFFTLISVFVILLCAALQLRILIIGLNNIEEYKTIFPPTKNLELARSQESNRIVGISVQTRNTVFNEIISSINNYLSNNKGTSIEFAILKDIVERNSNSLKDEIETQVPFPVNIGLMGTMIGIVTGVGSLVYSGNLQNLVAASESPQIDGIISLLTSVGVAMITSIIGIISTTILSNSIKKAKASVEEEKNHFLSWMQSEILPKMSTNFAAVIDQLTSELNNFNETFDINTQGWKEAQGTIGDTYAYQVQLLQQLEKLKIVKIATANIDVYDKLKKCTDEIGTLGQYLQQSNVYLQNVKELNQQLGDANERSQMIEEMAQFFKEERSQFSYISSLYSNTSQQLDLVVEEMKENIKNQFDALAKHAISQTDQYQKIIDEESEVLSNRTKELKEIYNEINQLGSVKKSINSLETAITQQSNKMNEFVKSMQEIVNKDVRPSVGFPTLNGWQKKVGIGIVATIVLGSFTQFLMFILFLI